MTATRTSPGTARGSSSRALTAWAAVTVALLATPVVYLVARAIGAEPGASLALVLRPRTAELLLTSLGLALAVAASVAVVGTLQAIALARLRLPAARALLIATALPLAMPSYVAAFGWLGVVPSLQGFWAAWLVLTVVSAPYVALPVHAALRGVPAGLEITARSLGRGPVAAFAQATWPVVRPAATAGALLAGLYAIADFGVVSLLRVETLTVGVARAMGAGFDRSYAALLGLVLVLAAVSLLLLEQLVRRASPAVRMRAAAAPRIRPGGWAWPAVALVLATPLAGVVAPIAALIGRALSAESVRALDAERLVGATATTLGLSAAAAALAVLLAAPVALLAARRPSRAARALEAIATLAHGLPGIVVGLSLVFLSLLVVPWAYQSAGVLVAAYALLGVPRAVGGLRAAIARVPERFEHLARTLGRGRMRALAGTTGRIALPGVAVAALLAAVGAMKELPATLLLRPTGIETLPTALWARTDVSEFGAAAPYALALVACAAVPAMLVLAASAERQARPVGGEA